MTNCLQKLKTHTNKRQVISKRTHKHTRIHAHAHALHMPARACPNTHTQACEHMCVHAHCKTYNVHNEQCTTLKSRFQRRLGVPGENTRKKQRLEIHTMYRTNKTYPPNPDSSGASAFLEKTLEKKKQRLEIHTMYKTNKNTHQIPIPAAPRRSWRKHSKIKTEVRNSYNVQNKQKIPTKSRFQRRLGVPGENTRKKNSG